MVDNRVTAVEGKATIAQAEISVVNQRINCVVASAAQDRDTLANEKYELFNLVLLKFVVLFVLD